MGDVLFKAEDVRFESRGNTIIGGISLEIKKGETVAFVGKSGCGKSTMLKLLSGIIIPTSGKIFYKEKNLDFIHGTELMEMRRNCAFVFQDSALWANQTIQQNLEVPLKTHYGKMTKMEVDFSVQGVCAMVSYDRPLVLRPSDLSAGEQKKIAFARAMICGPEVLFLDECVESLDEKGSELIKNLVHNFIDQGHTVIYTSHDKEFVQEFPATIYRMNKGVLVDEI